LPQPKKMNENGLSGHQWLGKTNVAEVMGKGRRHSWFLVGRKKKKSNKDQNSA